MPAALVTPLACSKATISSIIAFCIAPLLCELYLVASGFSACHSSKGLENISCLAMIFLILAYDLRISSGLELK